MNIIRDIVLSASEIPPGHTERGVCPFCNGGKTHEKSFAITRAEDGAVLYHCHRANCGTSGRIGGLKTQKSRKSVKKQTAKPFTGRLTRLPDEVAQFLVDRFGGVPRGFMWAPDLDGGKGRVAMPIWGPTGKRRGWSLRSYDRYVVPKSLVFMDYDEPVMSWYVHDPSDRTVWIVEDQMSAAKLCDTVAASSVAMLGVGLHEDRKVQELTKHVDRLVIALDPDATKVAVAAKRNLRLWFDDIDVKFLDKDIKDMTVEEIKCLVF